MEARVERMEVPLTMSATQLSGDASAFGLTFCSAGPDGHPFCIFDAPG